MKKEIEALARAYQAVINPEPIEESHFKIGDEVYHKEGEGKVVAVDKEGKGAYYTVELENGKKVKAKPEDLKADDDEDEKEDMKEAKMDPVGQADADINNDGKVDNTDKYLHKRRKAIGKAMKKGEGTATMNPKAETTKDATEQKESVKSADKKPEEYTDEKGKKRVRMVPMDKEVTKESMSIRDKLMSVLEKKDHGRTDNKQEYDDQWSPGAKKMKADLGPQEPTLDIAKVAADNVKEVEKTAKVSPRNPTDKSAPADKNIINPVDDITKKAGMKESFTKTVKAIGDAYKAMYAPKDDSK